MFLFIFVFQYFLYKSGVLIMVVSLVLQFHKLIFKKSQKYVLVFLCKSYYNDTFISLHNLSMFVFIYFDFTH